MRLKWKTPGWFLHGEVRDVGSSRDLELEESFSGSRVPVQHVAVHRSERVVGDDGGFDG